MKTFQHLTMLALCLVLACNLSAQETADKKDEKAVPPAPIKMTMSEGDVLIEASGTWKKKAIQSRIVAHELKIPRVKDDPADGRLTIGPTGGGVRANIQRWEGQFAGTSAKKETKFEVDGHQVFMVDITGTFNEALRGPMGPKTKREDYRMLAALIDTEGHGLYYFKLTGPKATLEANKKHFKTMLKSFKVVD